MNELLREIRNCKVCEAFLPLGPKPVIAAHSKSRIVVIGQAPGRIVHETGVPWNDKSGDNLREWMGVDKATFYDPEKFALMPMGFCYPGRGKSGDLPPRPECAPLWHGRLLDAMKDTAKATLTETILLFDVYLPDYFPLPHPSPRNNIWQAKNKWFTEKVLPELKTRVKAALI
jgi:uracil-DNA glycosylase